MKYNFKDITTEVKIDFVFDTLTKGNIGILGGIGAVGKSYFVLEQIIKYLLFKERIILTSSAIRFDFNKVMLITTEDEYNLITIRLQNILKNLFKVKNIKEIKDIEKIETILNNSFHLEISNNIQETNNTIKEIKDIDLLLLDTLSVILNLKNENDNSEVARKIEDYKQIARTKNIAIIFIHHLSQAGIAIKDKTDITADLLRGATTLLNNTRYVAILAKTQDELIYQVVKNNNGMKTQVNFECDFWNNGFQEIKKGGF